MLLPNHIKAILFDLDGTLRHNLPAGGEVVGEYARSLGLEVSSEYRVRCLRWEHSYWAKSSELHADLGQYEENSRDFWLNYNRRQLLAMGAIEKHAAELAPLVSKYMEENYRPASVPAPEAQFALTHLKQAGLRLGVVSNREQPFVEELVHIGLDSYFEFSLAAGEVQSYKPEPAIFEAALKRIDAAAQETVYVGDNYFADVVGARNAGLRPVLYDPHGIYPEADCTVITSFAQLLEVLETV